MFFSSPSKSLQKNIVADVNQKKKKNMTDKDLNPFFEFGNEKVYFNYPLPLLIINSKILFIFKAYYTMRASVWKLVLVNFRVQIRHLLIVSIINQW